MDARIRVAIAANDRILEEFVQAIVRSPDIYVVATITSSSELRRVTSATVADVLLLAIQFDGRPWGDVVDELEQAGIACPVVLLTPFNADALAPAVRSSRLVQGCISLRYDQATMRATLLQIGRSGRLLDAADVPPVVSHAVADDGDDCLQALDAASAPCSPPPA